MNRRQIGPGDFGDSQTLGLTALWREAEACMGLRGKTLSVEIVTGLAKPGRIRYDDGGAYIEVRPVTDHYQQAYMVAHELCHAIASCCGFSYQRKPTDREPELRCGVNLGEQIAVEEVLLDPITSCLPHIAVHSLLASVGIPSTYIDRHLIEDAQTLESSEHKDEIAMNALWVLQSRKLEEYQLPGLGSHELLEAYEMGGGWSSTLSEVAYVLSETINLRNLLDPPDCLLATNDLADAIAAYSKISVKTYYSFHMSCDANVLEEVIQRLGTVASN